MNALTMNNVKLIVIIIAVNVKAEHETSKHNPRIEHEKRSHSTELITPVMNGFDEKSSEASLGRLDYGSTEYEETENGHARRFAVNKEDTDHYEDRSANQEHSEEDRNQKEERNESKPPKRKIISHHHVFLDTKGRSAAEDLMEESLKIAAPGINVGDPRVINPMNGLVTPNFATITRPALFRGPLYPVNQPLLLPTNPDQNAPRRPQIEETHPFVNSNSYPYETPLTKVNTPSEENPQFDLLKKLIEATNTATTGTNPVSIEPNLFPGNLNLGAGRFRRAITLKSLRTM